MIITFLKYRQMLVPAFLRQKGFNFHQCEYILSVSDYVKLFKELITTTKNLKHTLHDISVVSRVLYHKIFYGCNKGRHCNCRALRLARKY